MRDIKFLTVMPAGEHIWLSLLINPFMPIQCSMTPLGSFSNALLTGVLSVPSASCVPASASVKTTLMSIESSTSGLKLVAWIPAWLRVKVRAGTIGSTAVMQRRKHVNSLG